MTTNNDIPDLYVHGKGRGDFTLPAGYIDGKGRVFNHIYLREMSGVEDDIMDDDELNVSDRISRVLTNCTEKLSCGETVIDDKKVIQAAIDGELAEAGLEGHALSIPDRMAALLFLRRISVGDIYRFDRKCPECKKLLKNKEIDLSKLKITAAKDATKRRVRVTLPGCGKAAILRVLTASGERRVSEMRPTMKNVKSWAIVARLESLGGAPLPSDSEAALAVVQGLSKKDRVKLISTFNLMEGGIETEIELKCSSTTCNTEFMFDIDLGQVFFSSPEREPKPDALEWI